MAEPIEPADELLIRIWRVLSRVAVPVMMAMAYALLVATSDVEASGAFWMGFGFVLVMIAWVVFRRLTDAAALARALSVGDVVKLEELGKRKAPKFAVARALAALLRGDFDAAWRIASDESTRSELALVIRLVVQLEQGRVGIEISSEARAATLLLHSRSWVALANGLLRQHVSQIATLSTAERLKARDDAAASLEKVIDDVLATGVARALAHRCRARIAEAADDAALAAKHRRAVAALAAPEATLLRTP